MFSPLSIIWNARGMSFHVGHAVNNTTEFACGFSSCYLLNYYNNYDYVSM